MIKEYWNLIGQEPFLAITWELDFSQACSFRRMLMNHKNFHFTQISNKNNDVILLKSPKTKFLGHFDHFCPMGIFSKKSGSVTHKYTWTPNTTPIFRKKLMSQPREHVRSDFPAFGLNTERHSVSFWKMRTRITPNVDTFHTGVPTICSWNILHLYNKPFKKLFSLR